MYFFLVCEISAQHCLAQGKQRNSTPSLTMSIVMQHTGDFILLHLLLLHVVVVFTTQLDLRVREGAAGYPLNV